MIPLCEPTLGDRELSYLGECIRDGWVSAEGPFVSRFEQAVAAHHGAEMHAACTSSGTTALQLALTSLGLAPGDLVIVPALSFLATLNPVIHCGAEPLVLDVEAESLGLDPGLLLEWLERHTLRRSGAVYERGSGRRVFGVIAVHLYGMPCAIARIRSICDDFGLCLIEDNAEALGALAGGAPTGSFGNAAVLSFNGNKAITAGGGGMVISRSEAVTQRVRSWANHARRDSSSPPTDYGFNYRISNLQAAVGLAQFERRDELLAARRRLGERYRRGLLETGLELLRGHSGDASSCWLHIARDTSSKGAEELQQQLGRAGIATRRLFQPFDLDPLYSRFARQECCVAQREWRRCLALPSSAHLTVDQQDHVIHALHQARPRVRHLAEALG